MPHVTVIRRVRDALVMRIVDCQIQRVRAGTEIRIGVIVDVSTRLRVDLAVPRVTFASRFGLDVVRAVVDRQMQRVGAGATADINVFIPVNS